MPDSRYVCVREMCAGNTIQLIAERVDAHESVPRTSMTTSTTPRDANMTPARHRVTPARHLHDTKMSAEHHLSHQVTITSAHTVSTATDPPSDHFHPLTPALHTPARQVTTPHPAAAVARHFSFSREHCFLLLICSISWSDVQSNLTQNNNSAILSSHFSGQPYLYNPR